LEKGFINSAHKTGKLVTIPLLDYLAEDLLRYKGNNRARPSQFEG